MEIECSNCGTTATPTRWWVSTVFGIYLLIAAFLAGILYFATYSSFICEKCGERNHLTKILNNGKRLQVKAWSKKVFLINVSIAVGLHLLYSWLV